MSTHEGARKGPLFRVHAQAMRPLPGVCVADQTIVTSTPQMREALGMVHEVGERVAWYTLGGPWPAWMRHVQWARTPKPRKARGVQPPKPKGFRAKGVPHA